MTAATLLTPAQGYAVDAHVAINCEYSSLCAEVADPGAVFGSQYVGHDEPSLAFYSDVPGAGNHMTYSFRLPRDPSSANPNTLGKSYQFELNGSFWLGMALCATQSYPEQVSTCTPDSDSNIVDLAVHPGTAFLELQFFPPGWIPWPTWAVAVGAGGCDATKWCAAMNIFSLAEDPINGTTLNATCAAQIGGLEYVNFAFVTKNGLPTAPPNPVQSTLATFTPDPQKDLLMSSGDQLSVSLHDTPDGVQVVIHDLTSGETGSMTASAANGFGQVQYDPTGTSCVNIPYDFHPMYSTSSEQTRVPWTAHTTNISFADEIGHFENCNGPNPIPATPFGVDASGNPIACPAGNTEGFGGNTSPTDADDNFCFPGTEALLINVNGCTDANTGFDGFDYQPVWPDGNGALHPEPVLFSSPLTGASDAVNYSRVAFEANLPRIESTCNRTTGAGCTLIPTTDKGTPAAFYPFFSALRPGGKGNDCLWAFGNDLPGASTDFGRNAQYGSLLTTTFLAFGGGGATVNMIDNFRQIIGNPCSGPIGGDDTGNFPSDKNVLKCEDGVGKAASKLAGAVIKCHTAAADAAVAGKTFDEEGCETAASGKYDATVGKLASLCPSCLNTTTIRDNAISQLDAAANALVYCEAGTPFGDDDSGNVPSGKTTLKCADGAYKNMAKQLGGIVKCHQKQVDSLFKGKTFDEETCEGTATSKASAANAKLTGCAPCLSSALSGLPGLVESMIDSINGQTYCASPSGAFLN